MAAAAAGLGTAVCIAVSEGDTGGAAAAEPLVWKVLGGGVGVSSSATLLILLRADAVVRRAPDSGALRCREIARAEASFISDSEGSAARSGAAGDRAGMGMGVCTSAAVGTGVLGAVFGVGVAGVGDASSSTAACNGLSLAGPSGEASAMGDGKVMAPLGVQLGPCGFDTVFRSSLATCRQETGFGVTRQRIIALRIFTRTVFSTHRAWKHMETVLHWWRSLPQSQRRGRSLRTANRSARAPTSRGA